MGAPLPPVPNVLELRIAGTTPGELWANIFHMQYSGTPPTSSGLPLLTNQLVAAWTANMAAECPSPIVLTSATATDLNSNTGAQSVHLANVPGTRGDDIMAANAAMLISYPSSLRFRGGHFRSYLLVGGNADNQDGMNWHSAFVVEVQAHWISFMQSLVGFTFSGTTLTQLVGLKRHGKYLPNTGHGGPNTPPYVLTTPIVVPLVINQITAHQQIASQKGRIGRRKK